MADFITKKENGRRLAIIILCVLVDAVALARGIYDLKNTNEIEKKPENPKNIQKMTEKVRELRRANVELEDVLLRYGARIGWKTVAAGSIDRDRTGAVNTDAMKSFLSDFVRLPKERASKGEKAPFEALGIGGYKRWDEQGGEKGLLLKDLFDELLKKEADFKTKIGDHEAAIKAERENEKKIKADIESSNAAAQKELDGGVPAAQAAAGHIGDLIRLMKELNKLEKDHADELVTLEKEAIDAQNKLTETRNDFVRKRAAAEAVKADYKRRIYAIQHHRMMAVDLMEPDGQILAVHESLNLAYINLLRKDRLFKGTKFTVFSLEKGGEKLAKGTIEVAEVREELSSVCAVLRVNSPDWPFKVGDFIFNELYEGGRPRHIAFAGRFTGKLSNDEAASLIRKSGDLYQEKVDENTNYVVVADGYETHPNFKAAEEYGIKILREKILYDYLGVRRD
jgi:hypothetical protein